MNSAIEKTDKLISYFRDAHGDWQFVRVEPLPSGKVERANKLETHRPLICGLYCVTKGISDEDLYDLTSAMHDRALWPISNMHYGLDGEILRDENGDLLQPTQEQYEACFDDWSDVETALYNHTISTQSLSEALDWRTPEHIQHLKNLGIYDE